VSEELLAVFNCSVLTFWSAIKFHCEIEPEYITICWLKLLKEIITVYFENHMTP
jgi:hypothetical protein